MINIYCVIQKVKPTKRDCKPRIQKELEVYWYEWEEPRKYRYRMDGEYFEREMKPSYKISIHKSYRENGKVKKKQWPICTISYYSIIDWGSWIGDYNSEYNKALDEMGIEEQELLDMIYDKLDPIVETIKKEYEATEEYKSDFKHKAILDEYQDKKKAFEDIYGNDTYNCCYDVFGTLREPEMLENIKRQYKARQQYSSSYYDNYKSNYNNYSSSGYFENKASTYTEEEKKSLKAIYKAAALKLHPDTSKDNGEAMKLLNKLKEEWGI